MDPSEIVRIGRTDVMVSRMGLGLASMIGHSGAVDDRSADAIVTRARILGIRYVDVAPQYGLGRGESALRRDGSSHVDGPLTVSTKAGRLLRERTLRNRLLVRARELRYSDRKATVVGEYRRMAQGRLVRAISPDSSTGSTRTEPTQTEPTLVAIQDFSTAGVRRSATESLARLGRDRSDLMFLHDPDGLRGSRLARAWEPLREMRASGKIGAIGISGNDAHSMAAMMVEVDPDVILLAGRYTLLDQSALDHLLPLAIERDVSVILGGIFNGGILADPAEGDRFDYRPARADERERARRIASIAASFGVPITAAAIQFAAAHPAVISVLVGVRSEHELAVDVDLAQTPIPTAFWDALIAAGLIRRDVPIPPMAEVLEAKAS